MSRGRSRASTRRREPAPPQSLHASPHPLGISLRPCVAEQWASAFWRRNPPGVIRRPPTRTSASDLRPINYVVVQCGDRQFCRPWESTQLSLSSHFTVVRAPQQYCVAPIEPRYFPYLPPQLNVRLGTRTLAHTLVEKGSENRRTADRTYAATRSCRQDCRARKA